MDSRMLSGTSEILPFFPMPDDSANVISKALGQRFKPSYVCVDHEFTARNQKGRLRINYAAFTDQLHHDLDTSAIVVYYEPQNIHHDDAIVSQVALSGSPFVFIAREHEVIPYGIGINGKIKAIQLSEPLSYSQVGNFFEQYKTDLNPGRIQAVKAGSASFEIFSGLNSHQLRLFALNVTRVVLAETFGNAVNLVRSAVYKQSGSGHEEKVIDISVKLLGAIILAHKGRLGSNYESEYLPFNHVYKRAHDLFPSYFDIKSIEKYLPTIEVAFSKLQEATYSSFTPDMLSELYTQAYPDKEKRKLEGRFDTPLFLTRLILKNIPFENLRPERRVIADITCGWGSFLVSGYERLSAMIDMTGLQLRNHIFGNDKDFFTAQLARIALLTTALQDNWKVKNQDAISLTYEDFRPSVIVGNPKFFGDRKSGDQATSIDQIDKRTTRFQEADRFLIKAIELLAPGGYLGMLMPQSFTIGEASTNARKTLLETCDILELWDLPLSIFGNQASVSPMVVFARKREQVGGLLNYPVRIRSSQGSTLENTGTFTASSLAPSQDKWGETSRKAKGEGAKVTNMITYTTIFSEPKWAEIFRDHLSMADVSVISPGAIIGTKRRWKEYPSPKEVLWLSGAKDSIPRSFCINYGSKTVIYPNELEEPRKSRWPERDKEYLLASNKVLLVADPNPSWGKRTKVAIERRGYYPSNHFWVLAPKKQGEVESEISLEVLAAVLSWDVSNAWIVESFRYPWIQKRTLEQIPFPKLSLKSARKIQEAVMSIEKAAVLGRGDKDAQGVIDTILREAYDLDDETFGKLRAVMEWDNKSLRGNKVLQVFNDWISVKGSVEEVNGINESITLWFESITGTYTVPINSEMPGWMLRSGASFVVDLPYEDFKNKKFSELICKNIRPKDFPYLSEEELIERLSIELSGGKKDY